MAPLPTTLIDALIPREGEHLADPYLASLTADNYKRSLDSSSTTTLSPLQAHDLAKRAVDAFNKRDVSTQHSGFTPGGGAKPPTDFNNQGFLALFATIGALMVLASLWFFFWAKNGGFKFRQGDWDDYKSTVLRRKGPDGKTLSNATKSTKLGGGSIAGTQRYKWAKQTAKSVVSYDEKGRRGITGKRGWGKTHSVTYSDERTDSLASQTVSDMTEVRDMPPPPAGDYGGLHSKRYRDRDVREYKRERPARVGGLNRVADGYDSGVTGSDLSHSSEQPILQKDRDRAKERERAERRAREEAARMEHRWKREAEEAAAALARESARATIPPPKKAASPQKPASSKQPRRDSRSNSPKKRDFSYSRGAESEVLSTAYTSTSGTRSASYYNAYRPRAESSDAYASDHGNRSRQSSPKKNKPQRASQGGYRRGADADLD